MGENSWHKTCNRKEADGLSIAGMSVARHTEIEIPFEVCKLVKDGRCEMTKIVLVLEMLWKNDTSRRNFKHCDQVRIIVFGPRPPTEDQAFWLWIFPVDG
jgi:hypothetical protein